MKRRLWVTLLALTCPVWLLVSMYAVYIVWLFTGRDISSMEVSIMDWWTRQ